MVVCLKWYLDPLSLHHLQKKKLPGSGSAHVYTYPNVCLMLDTGSSHVSISQSINHSAKQQLWLIGYAFAVTMQSKRQE